MFDNTCKFLAELYPREFSRWLLNEDPGEVSILKSELSLEPIRADSVTFLQSQDRILHIEFQTLPKSDVPIPIRMLDYSVRLKRQYGCPVDQVVIFLKQTDSPKVFEECYTDETTLHRYRVIRMWEQDPELFLSSPGLLPLASLARTDSPVALLQQIVEQVATIESTAQRENLSACAALLAGLRFEETLIAQFFSEDIMQESVIYQSIQQKEALRMVSRFITKRLGNISPNLQTQLQGLTADQLETLNETVPDFSTETDLIAWLKRQN